jgi:monoamine oxidase
VVIVGGGLAGLAAALALTDAGVPCVVYEGGGRAGGRVRSDTRGYFADGQVAEWGGELINSDHTTMQGLARRFGLGLVDLHAGAAPGTRDTYRLYGRDYALDEADRDFRPVYRALRRDLAALGPAISYARRTPGGVALDRLSIAEWIASRVPAGGASRLGTLLDLAYAVEFGAETAEQSALNLVQLLGEQPKPGSFALLGASDERYRIAGGNERVPAAIAAALPADTLRLGWRLTGLAREADGRVALGVDTPEGARTVRADHVILALPFAVLRTLDLDRSGFDPLKRRAIAELGQGRNRKGHLQFAGRSWERADGVGAPGTGSAVTDVGPLATWESSRGQGGTHGLLVTFQLERAAGVPAASAWADAGAPHVAAGAREALAALEVLWPGVGPRWTGRATLGVPALDPLLRTTYAYYRVGQYHAFAGYEAVRQGNVHFAGEHCSRDYQGYMEGAAREGQRAARAVLADLGRRARPAGQAAAPKA